MYHAFVNNIIFNQMTGASSSLSDLDIDCVAPRNINDFEISPGIAELPPSRSISVFTDSSFLHEAAQSTRLRSRLCTLTNRYHDGLDFHQVLGFEKEIHDALTSLPIWTDTRSLQAAIHLDLLLRQWLVILHTPRAFQPHLRMQPNHRYSLFACLEHSATLIDKHFALVEAGNFALCCIRSDYYRAALIICHITYHASRSKGKYPNSTDLTYVTD